MAQARRARHLRPAATIPRRSRWLTVTPRNQQSARGRIGNFPRAPEFSWAEGIIGEPFMRVFLGIILGAVLTIGGAYYYDSMQTSSVAAGPGAGEHRTMVNWDVVEENWRSLKARAQDTWVRLTA
jgi:hypothetical protein